jgi:hypothetical protein
MKQLIGFNAVVSTSLFGLLYNNVQYLQHSILMVKNCKPVFSVGFLQPMFYQWILNLVIRGEWLLRSSKPYLAWVFASVPVLCCLFNTISKLWHAMDVQGRTRPI